MNAAVDHVTQLFQQRLSMLAGQARQTDDLESMRHQALQALIAQGFPTVRDEGWKYMPLTALHKKNYPLAAPCSPCVLPALALTALQVPDLESYRLVFINGYYAPDHSTPPPQTATQSALTVSALSTVHLPARWTAATPASLGPLGWVAMNTALFTDGVYIHIPAHTQLDKPIYCVYIAVDTGQGGFYHVPRNWIHLDESAQATLIEHYVSFKATDYVTNVVSEVILAPQARLEHYKLHQEAEQATHLAFLLAKQSYRSEYIAHSIALGGRLLRNDIQVQLQAEHAQCTLNGLYLGHGRQHIDYHLQVDHQQPHGQSQQQYKGILRDYARAVFNGQVIVQPDAQKTSAQQSNHTLLLSDHAEIDTKPQLEIFANDVQCSHGATVGQLDETRLFYLRSRGIEYTQAQTLLLHGFIQDILQPMSLAPVRQYLEEKVF